MSKIEWTDATWNPLRGCSRVSEGCRNCYAEVVARRFAGPGKPYEGLVRLDGEGKPRARWNGTVRQVPEHLGAPLRWRKPRMVFVNLMSDLFHEAVPFEYIAAVFGVMAAAPQHTFQVLTKRPERAAEFFEWAAEGGHLSPGDALRRCRRAAADALDTVSAGGLDLALRFVGRPEAWPLPNVWIGVSIEDPPTAQKRIPEILCLPAAVRWVSYEPALAGVDFARVPFHRDHPLVPFNPLVGGGTHTDTPWRLDWVVIGGESGPGARPFDLAWARSTIRQCRAAGVPVFVKQLGAAPMQSVEASLVAAGLYPDDIGPAGRRPERVHLRNRKGGDPSEWPEDLRVREFPHAFGGRA
ncbi:MAG: phage Gp37/Gp68 family protein [Myxococcota bacterium]|nr:phage Gp37/Gp68 family protein [Myxococcota bacterium]